jgi:hypothetical protein
LLTWLLCTGGINTILLVNDRLGETAYQMQSLPNPWWSSLKGKWYRRFEDAVFRWLGSESIRKDIFLRSFDGPMSSDRLEVMQSTFAKSSWTVLDNQRTVRCRRLADPHGALMNEPGTASTQEFSCGSHQLMRSNIECHLQVNRSFG